MKILNCKGKSDVSLSKLLMEIEKYQNTYKDRETVLILITNQILNLFN